MEKVIKVNCYCFNQQCGQSIFNSDTYQAVSLPLQKVLTHPQYCDACGDELVCKPILEMRMQIYNLMPDSIPA